MAKRILRNSADATLPPPSINRWSLSYPHREQSHDDFITITHQFRAAISEVFATRPVTRVNLLTRPKQYMHSSRREQDDVVHAINQRNIFFSTIKLTEVTPHLFNRAAYIEVLFSSQYPNHPKNPKYPTKLGRGSQKPVAFHGHVEFKGNLPRAATFLIESGPKAELVRLRFMQRNRGLHIGDGVSTNGEYVTPNMLLKLPVP